MTLSGRQGAPSARWVLYVTDNALLRPGRYELTGDPGSNERLSFSGWHEKLRLTMPKDATPAGLLTPQSAGTVT